MLPGTWECLRDRIHSLAKLPLSLYGRMTILRSYLRPIILFQLALTVFVDTEGWLEEEARFLTRSTHPSPKALVAPHQLHPLNWGRLPPLLWEVDRRRVGLAATLTQVLSSHLPWVTVPPPLIRDLTRPHPLDPIRESLFRRAHLLSLKVTAPKGPRSLQCPPNHPLLRGDKAALLTLLTVQAEDAPLTLTPLQERWTSTYGTEWRSLWKAFATSTKKLRSPVISFLWRLLMVCLNYPTYGPCPYCGPNGPTSTPNHIFASCPTTSTVFTPNPLEIILTPPHTPLDKGAILALWATWKALQWATHLETLPPSSSLKKVALHSYEEETARAAAVGWL